MKVGFSAVAVGLLASPMSHAKESPCGSDLAIPLAIERTGHVSVALQIANKPVRLLVDTGANTNTLDIAESRKLNPEIQQADGLPKGHGSTQLPMSVQGVSLGGQGFSVMDLHFINIPSKKYGTEPFVGQLGAGFFTQFKARILFDSMSLCLSRAMVQEVRLP
jgi:hypothetical protein